MRARRKRPALLDATKLAKHDAWPTQGIRQSVNRWSQGLGPMATGGFPPSGGHARKHHIASAIEPPRLLSP